MNLYKYSKIKGFGALSSYKIIVMVKTRNEFTFYYLCGFSPSSLRVSGNAGYVPLNSFAALLGYEATTNTQTNTVTVSLKKSTPDHD